MYISRYIEENLNRHLDSRNEILIIYGARQVGKSTMINHLLDNTSLKSLRVTGEDFRFQTIFSGRNLNRMQEVVEGYDLLFIDEAQYIEQIGINIKMLHDANKEIKIILSGSSSFELANRISEPLTGRTKTILLYSLGFLELKNIFNTYELKHHIDQYLIFGGYPKLYQLNSRNDKISALLELSSAYLYKDILMFNRLRNTSKLYNLLKLIAFQLGNPVSVHELANNLKTSSETVERYIVLLEQSFVVYRLSGFAGNLRKEISKMNKIYFYDLGIRNAIIENFATLDNRNDKGALWENFLVTERLKKIKYKEWFRSSYYWRTYSGVELDYIEKYDGKVCAYEFKWRNKKPKAPITWTRNYPNATYQLINRENFLSFIV